MTDMRTWPEISKAVGWDAPDPLPSYPYFWQVVPAWIRRDTEKFLYWNRFLPSPSNDYEVLIMVVIVDRLHWLRDAVEARETRAPLRLDR